MYFIPNMLDSTQQILFISSPTTKFWIRHCSLPMLRITFVFFEVGELIEPPFFASGPTASPQIPASLVTVVVYLHFTVRSGQSIQNRFVGQIVQR